MVPPPQVFTLTRAAPASRGASIEAPTPPAATNAAASKHASTRFIAMPVPPPRSHVNAIYIYKQSSYVRARGCGSKSGEREHVRSPFFGIAQHLVYGSHSAPSVRLWRNCHGAKAPVRKDLRGSQCSRRQAG